MVAEQKLWFKAKRYGWGWVPASWQGWLCGAMFILAVLVDALLFIDEEMVTAGSMVAFLAWVAICSTVLAAVSYKKGEKPHWRWGK